MQRVDSALGQGARVIHPLGQFEERPRARVEMQERIEHRRRRRRQHRVELAQPIDVRSPHGEPCLRRAGLRGRLPLLQARPRLAGAHRPEQTRGRRVDVVRDGLGHLLHQSGFLPAETIDDLTHLGGAAHREVPLSRGRRQASPHGRTSLMLFRLGRRFLRPGIRRRLRIRFGIQGVPVQQQLAGFRVGEVEQPLQVRPRSRAPAIPLVQLIDHDCVGELGEHEVHLPRGRPEHRQPLFHGTHVVHVPVRRSDLPDREVHELFHRRIHLMHERDDGQPQAIGPGTHVEVFGRFHRVPAAFPVRVAARISVPNAHRHGSPPDSSSRPSVRNRQPTATPNPLQANYRSIFRNYVAHPRKRGLHTEFEPSQSTIGRNPRRPPPSLYFRTRRPPCSGHALLPPPAGLCCGCPTSRRRNADRAWRTRPRRRAGPRG